MDFLHFHWGLVAFWIVKLLKVFGIIPGAIAATWLRKLYQKRRQTKAMEGWPSTQATIQSGKVHTEGGRHWAEITYSYFVAEYHSGTYVKNFRKEDDADEFVRQLRDAPPGPLQPVQTRNLRNPRPRFRDDRPDGPPTPLKWLDR